MLIKRITVFFLIITSAVLSAQAVKPMTQNEFRYYEYLIRMGNSERYRTPVMSDKLWKDLMNDIISQIIEAKVPPTIEGWKKKGASTIPSQSKIQLLAIRLRALINDPELPEVSRQQLQWFKNIGNGFIVLETYQSKMVYAVVGGRKKEYATLYFQYSQAVQKLKKLMEDRDDWRLSRQELNLIRRKNIAERKKKSDALKRRYEHTRQLLRDGKLKWDEPQNKKQNNRRKGNRR